VLNLAEKWQDNLEVIFLTEQEIKGNGPNIFEILKKDHQYVNDLFKQMVDSKKFNAVVYDQTKKALKAHFAGEEKLIYSRIENNREMRTLALEAYEAHDLGKQIMIDIDMSEDFSADWLYAKVKMLSVAVSMHFTEEETDLFEKVKNVFSAKDESELGRLFEQEKNVAMK
jgi:hemerythrin superfamily protein